MAGKSRVFYRQSPEGVVVEKEGHEIAVYRDAEQLVETHIKGLVAIDHEDARKVRELFQRYGGPRPKPD